MAENISPQNAVGSQKKERQVTFDLMRILAMIMVIMIHLPFKPFAGSILFSNLLNNLLFTSNSLFFMLSGRLNLTKTFETRSDYISYYKKKFIGIILPYVICSLLLALRDMHIQEMEITFLSFLNYSWQALMSGNSNTHLWFMFQLIGMLLTAPFLAKLLQGMRDWELKMLLGIALVWHTVRVYLTEDWGIEFAYSGWILNGWIIHFAAGYICYRLFPQKVPRRVWLVGAVSLALNVAGGSLWGEHYQYATDLSPFFTIYCICAFLLLEKKIHIQHKKVSRIIRQTAQYSYLIYFFHPAIISDFTLRLIPQTKYVLINFAMDSLITLIAALLLSLIIQNLLIRPLQAGAKRLLKLR